MSIQATLVGGNAAIVRFEQYPANLRAKLEDCIKSLSFDLVRDIKSNYLSGSPLKRQTGRLSRSINAKFEGAGTDVFRGIIGTNVAYAAYHEYGFSGPVQVQAFDRKITMAFGRQLKTPVIARVGPFTRQVNYPAHPFLRPALESMIPEINSRMSDALNQAGREVMAR